ncbi:hypothetical protein EV683_12114 [Crenobacter luteus]|uniref:hypothetical protein n=1 Tax=Crenobacter luteus TaxID=1452487 RepID=UPI00104CFF91|nr:hypothetical protein [Crenobacter luteus]TCP10614.1 hypothetical protein EV683_12114 [Crenobacter luteus]
MPDSLLIELTPDTIRLSRLEGWWRQRVTALGETALGPLGQQGLADALGGLLDEHRCVRRRTAVVVSDTLARLFMVEPPRNAARPGDCKAAAELRFHALYGDNAAAWVLRADWDARHPFLAGALPCELLDGLRQAASAHKLALTRVQPHFVAQWNRWRRRLKGDAWFGCAHAGVLTLGLVAKGRLLEVRSLHIPAEAAHDAQWLDKQLARVALRSALTAPPRIQLCGTIPMTWLENSPDGVTRDWLDPVPPAADTPADEAAAGALAREGVRS